PAGCRRCPPCRGSGCLARGTAPPGPVPSKSSSLSNTTRPSGRFRHSAREGECRQAPCLPIITFDETPNASNQSVKMCTVRIRVLFFGVIRDVVGLREDTLDIAEGGNLGSVFEHYAGRFPRLRGMAGSTVLALNQQFSSPS